MAEHLGRKASRLLEAKPFKNWPVHRYVHDDSDPPLIGYTFEGCGLEINCDVEDECVLTVFLEAEEHDGMVLSEVSFNLGRDQVLAHFGSPSKSGERYTSEFLGDIGSWDRFQGPEYTVHVQYKVDSDCIEMITLMRNDIAP